jgi:RNA polymerase sigma factor (sigma-70 family)
VFYNFERQFKSKVSSPEPETYKETASDRSRFIGELYSRYGRKLYSYAVYTWKLNEDAAWELVYKTLYKVIDSYNSYSFENEEKFASFIFKVFINYLRNHYRDSRKAAEQMPVLPIGDIEIAEREEGLLAVESANIKLKMLTEELEKMEDWQRMLLLLRSQGTSYSEIARFIDKPENQLKVYYQRLKEQISKKLNERL